MPVQEEIWTQTEVHSSLPADLLQGDADFPPLVSSPSQKNHQHHLNPSAENAWKKPLAPLARPQLRFNLRFIPPDNRGKNVVGVCPKDSVAGELVVLDFTLVGFFLGKKPSFSFVRSALLRQWKLRGAVEILQLIHGGFAFRFSELQDRDSILDGNVYFVGGQPMFIRQWERNIHNGGILGLRKIPLWVSLPGLPLHLWGEDSLSAICSVLGKPLYTDSTTATKSRWSFARVCVEFSGDKPLLNSISIEDDEGNGYEQVVQYEWIPPQCLKCGVFGHANKTCLMKPSEADSNPAPEEAEIPKEKNSMEDLMEDKVEDGSELGPEDLLREEHLKNVTSGSLPQMSRWHPVRVRKKRPSGVRPIAQIQTRPMASSAKAVGAASAAGGVSSLHWPAPGLSQPNQVQQSAPLHIKPPNSNFDSCKLPVTCPPNPFGCLDTNFEIMAEKSGNLETPRPVACDPVETGSTAGHTPFRSRPPSLARDTMGLVEGPDLPLPASLSGRLLIPRSGPDKPSTSFSLLKSISASRGVSGSCGTGPRFHTTSYSRSIEDIPENGVDGASFSTTLSKEDGVMNSHISDGRLGKNNTNPKTSLNELGSLSNGKGKVREEGRDTTTKYSDL